MLADILIYVGGGIFFLWGIAHVAPTKRVVRGFGRISTDSRRLITMTLVGDAAHHDRLDRVHRRTHSCLANEALPTGEDHSGGLVPVGNRALTPQANPRRT